jgi:hypothetical protein
MLPFVSTVFLMLRGESPRQRVLHLGACGLAAGAGLYIGLSSHPRLFWALWGVWLYIGVAASAPMLELLVTFKKTVSRKVICLSSFLRASSRRSSW